jgi:hypothetical protein
MTGAQGIQVSRKNSSASLYRRDRQHDLISGGRSRRDNHAKTDALDARVLAHFADAVR